MIDKGAVDWDEFIEAVEILKEWAKAEDRDEVLAAMNTIIAAVNERLASGFEGEGEADEA